MLEGIPEGIEKLNRDLLAASKLLTPQEIRYFVNTYYDLQDFRIAAANQQRHLEEKPSEFMEWFNKNLHLFESQIHNMLNKWSNAQPMGVWAREIVGIGPVISAGLCAHINIEKAPTVGHIWRFAGLDPTVKWEKGEKRPWNARLKRLCWIIGESFTKFCYHEKDVYGKLILQRRAYENKRNEEFYNKPECDRRLAEDLKKPPKKRMKADLRKFLEGGKLYDKALHERSKRWAVKQFLSDWHGEAYRKHFGTEPPLPYPIAILGHAHLRKP